MISLAIMPGPEDEPTGRIIYDDDGTRRFAVLDLDAGPHQHATLNLGRLDDTETIIYLHQLATQARKIAQRLTGAVLPTPLMQRDDVQPCDDETVEQIVERTTERVRFVTGADD